MPAEYAGGQERLILDPWHYLPVLEKKPGALVALPLHVAKLPVHRDLGGFQWLESPKPKQQIRQLATEGSRPGWRPGVSA